MKEVYVFCEGQTEQVFCQQVLQPHWFPHGGGLLHPIRIAHSRRHGVTYRGGISTYRVLRTDIQNALKQHRRSGVLFTSMIDLYGLPRDFPGKAATTRNPADPRLYVEALEEAFGNDIADRRFIPHLQLHEFETLLFADVESFRHWFELSDSSIQKLQRIAASFPTVEHIDDGQDTAPSKRIIHVVPDYKGLKTTAGPSVASQTGIRCLCKSCPHFGKWVEQIAARLARN